MCARLRLTIQLTISNICATLPTASSARRVKPGNSTGRKKEMVARSRRTIPKVRGTANSSRRVPPCPHSPAISPRRGGCAESHRTIQIHATASSARRVQADHRTLGSLVRRGRICVQSARTMNRGTASSARRLNCPQCARFLRLHSIIHDLSWPRRLRILHRTTLRLLRMLICFDIIPVRPKIQIGILVMTT